MNPIESRLDDLDRWKSDFLGSLSASSPERLAFRANGVGWNALDVVQHLVLVEEAVLAYARKKLLAPPQPVSIVDRGKLVLLVGILRSPIRFRAPVAQVVPSETLPLEVSADRWGQSRRDLRSLLLGLPEERRAALFFRHPAAGGLDPAGTLVFVHEHARHHETQVRRIGRAPGAPR